MEIKIIKNDFKADFESVKSILKKFKKADSFKKVAEPIVVQLDFDQNNTSHLNLALIWKLILNLQKRGYKVVIRYKGSAEPFLNDRHFFDRFTGKRNFSFSSSIPFHFETFNPSRDSDNNQNESVDKIFEDVTKKFLDSNNLFHKEIKIHMLEVIANSFDHSELINEAASICSLDPKSNTLDFCVIDTGQGIKQSFLNNPKLAQTYKEISDQDVIERATNFRISCNPVNARNPNYKYSNGGIGLFFLKEFIRMHRNCHLVIISKKGYYYINSDGQEKKKNFTSAEWSGTVVNFWMDVNQSKSKAYEDLSNRYIDKFDNPDINIV